MLNRRILRIKAFKVLFSYAENPAMESAEALCALESSCEATRDLYLLMLNVIPALTAEAATRIELAKGKYRPTEQDLNPNMKFVNNGIARILSNDPDFQKLISKKKLSWEQFDVFIRNLYDSLRSKEYFQNYMASDSTDPSEEAALFVKMFEEEFVDNTDLEKILEDMSIWWNDDLAYSLTWCCRTVEDLAAGKGFRLLPLYFSDVKKLEGKDVDSDSFFVKRLLTNAFATLSADSARVAESVSQWEKDRLFNTDLVLIAMGLSEARSFPEIPVKVTINEYVEISKYYSTPKSRAFVNGLLNKLIQEDIASGRIVKTGRGLL